MGKGEAGMGDRVGAHTLSYTPQTWGKQEPMSFRHRNQCPFLSGTNVLRVLRAGTNVLISLRGSTRKAPEGIRDTHRG